LSDSRICCISVESSFEGFPSFSGTFSSDDRGEKEVLNSVRDSGAGLSIDVGPRGLRVLGSLRLFWVVRFSSRFLCCTVNDIPPLY